MQLYRTDKSMAIVSFFLILLDSDQFHLNVSLGINFEFMEVSDLKKNEECVIF